MTYLIAYVPVLHEGYRSLFEKYTGATLYIVGPGQVEVEFPRLGRDLRQIPVEAMCGAIRGLDLLTKVEILEPAMFDTLNAEHATVVMPVDEISTRLAERLPGCTVRYENVFLRWDKPITLAEQIIAPDRVTSTEKLDQEFMQQAVVEAERSADWWRQVGAVAVKDGVVLFSGYNAHHPSEQAVLAVGNPRDNVDAGEHLEISDSLHGEAGIVARAARAQLAGVSVYVTTFPCINCARLLAEAGVGKVYYRDGYSRLDAEGVLKDHGVEIIRVVQ